MLVILCFWAPAAALMPQLRLGTATSVLHQPADWAAAARCRLVLSESSLDDVLDSGSDSDMFDMGLLKLPVLTTPDRAGHNSFRERQRQRTEKNRPRRAGDEQGTAQELPAGGNDLGFTLKETIFDTNDDAFGTGA
jgi:hypothetical protein